MKNNILSTMAYYDAIDFPLKAEELFRYLIKIENQETGKYNFQDLKKSLDDLILEGVVSIDNGFYYLDDRSYLVPLRKKKEKISVKKWVKARSAIRWLKFIPSLEAIFASGSLAINNCDELSDLDVLIVTKKGRIWLTRFLISGVLSLLQVRRKWSDKIAPDKICLNHYITDGSLNIPFENIYNAQTYINLKPILVKDRQIIKNFVSENKWLDNYISGEWDIVMEKNKIIKFSGFDKIISKVIDLIINSKIGNWLENLTRNYQKKRIETNPLSINPKGHIVYNDRQLAFHPDSPDQAVITAYELKLKELLERG